MCSAQSKNSIKLYGVIIGIITGIGQHGLYLLGHSLGDLIGFTPFLPKIPVIDDLFKLTPVFILPYVWAYIYWTMTPMIVSKCERKHFQKYLVAYIFSCVVGVLVLALFPTYMDRVAEGLMDTSAHTGFCADLMRFWYSLDGGNIAYNLLPSFHCLVSTISYLGVMGREEIPKWYRIYSAVLTVTIYLAVLFVKQHYFVDIVTGAGISIICWIICDKCNAGRILDKFMDRITMTKS